MTHIFLKNSNPQPTDRALCYYFRRDVSEPLDDYGRVCEDCSRMADAILRSSYKMPESKTSI
jgi:hypothetical protein